MKILIACEFSGTVRDAFTRRGFDAMSCDLLPSETPGNHYQGDVFDVINDGFDLMIAHPPCTHLAVSGARWFKDKKEEQKQAIEFFMKLINSNISKIAIENPISIMSTIYRKPDQIIQPWQFGHGEAKIHKMPPSPDRWKLRSKTYQGIADAMADQLGKVT
jgi:site-specific DNA-cytosine methylase